MSFSLTDGAPKPALNATRLKRQLSEQAIAAATAAEWQEAVDINKRMMLAPVAPLIAAPRPAAVKPSPPIDGGWPKSYVTPTGARVTLYQPQVADWKDQKHLTLYAAVAYMPSGATKPVLGTVTAEAQTKVSVSDRLVDFSVFTITDSNFPTLEKARCRRSSPRSPRRSRRANG